MNEHAHNRVFLELSILQYLVEWRRPRSIQVSLQMLLDGTDYPAYYNPVDAAYLKGLTTSVNQHNWRPADNVEELLRLLEPVDATKFYEFLTLLYKKYSPGLNIDFEEEPYLPALAGALAADAVLITQVREYKRFETELAEFNLQVIVIE